MKLRTEIEKIELNFKLDHSQKGLSLGSCFAENIASRLKRLRFDVCSNPFGILYNPASICSVLERVGQNRDFTENELFEHNNLWHSELHHGDFSSENPQDTLQIINSRYKEGVNALKNSSYVIITLGTAWVYKNAITGQVVGNCHKRAASDFTRHRLSVEEIISMLKKQIEGSLSGKKIIITVSPIRHIKDTLEGNSLSKATLILAAQTLKELYPERVNYFPSFEILNDDLRDYRFYKSDMIHPSDQAVDYVWSLFQEAVFSLETSTLNKQIDSLVSSSEHRVLKPNSPSHKVFCQRMSEKTMALKQQNPELKLDDLEQYFTSF
ncbi:MAG: GSCFA domain-containing protein [Rikenellaceae bacterium]